MYSIQDVRCLALPVDYNNYTHAQRRQYPRGGIMAELVGSDDQPQLSEHSLAALQEFYAERIALEGQFAANTETIGGGLVEENWVISEKSLLHVWTWLLVRQEAFDLRWCRRKRTLSQT